MTYKSLHLVVTGLVQGVGPATIARDLSRSIAGLSRARAGVIAQTEIINAHAEGQLDAFKQLGIKKVDAEVEWLTANDGKVCDDCASMEGEVYAVEEAHGLIPLHPNCRCCWKPYIELAET